MKKVLIINPFGIGDVLFTTSMINAIKQNSQDTRISYWCNERVRELIRNIPNLDKTFALSRGDLKRISRESKFTGLKKLIKLLIEVKREGFDTAFDFSLDHRYGMIAKLLGIKNRIGYNYKNRGRFLTHKINIEGFSEKHMVNYYADLLKFINIEPETNGLSLSVSEEQNTRMLDLLSNFGISENDILVGIAPGAGASWGNDASVKHWPNKKFAQLADKIITQLKTKIVIIGDKDERLIAQGLIKEMTNSAVDLTGKTEIRDLVALINNLDILITNDGGPLHIAVALGIKTVSIFGPVDPMVYGPYPPCAKHIVVTNHSLDCRPCYKNFRFNGCDYSRRCVEDISLEDVFLAVKELI
ncbi:MAG: glycosyltransferase family 9 protein [Candidatus Omnitrophica bacterium]|nr:glycosyltransferase family 9 protein [Candidatus Omnitrophota bacterium]